MSTTLSLFGTMKQHWLLKIVSTFAYPHMRFGAICLQQIRIEKPVLINTILNVFVIFDLRRNNIDTY